MKLLNIPISRLFTLIALSFLMGIALSSIITIDFNRSVQIVLISILLYLLVLLLDFVFKPSLLGLAAMFLIFMSMGLIYYSYSDSKTKELAIVSGQKSTIDGTVSSEPERTYNSQKIIITRENNQIISASIPPFPACYFGDQISLEGQADSVAGSFSERSLKAKKINGIVAFPTNVSCAPQKLTPKDKFIKGLYVISDKFEEILGKSLPEPEASFAAGIILGSKRNIPQNLSEALNITGLTHVIALSGYNITIMIVVISEILSYYLSKKYVFLSSIGIILVFVIMTGASSSVVRAAIFSLSLVFGRLIGRRGDLTNLMLLAAVLMVLFNPFILMFDIGFQLSFLAFSGLIYLSPVLNLLLDKTFLNKLPEIIFSTLRETLSAQIMVFPIIMFYFGRVSIISPLSNILILWLIPLSMLLAFVVGLAGLLFQPLGSVAAILAWPALALVINLTLFLAKIPLASIEMQKMNYIVLLFYPIIILITIYLSKKQIKMKSNEKNY